MTLQKAPDGNKEEPPKEDLFKKIENIYAHYKEKIHESSRLTDGAKMEIKKRLKNYTENDLMQAMDNFSQNKWYMENNSHRGVAWFFESDEHIDQFVNLPKAEKPKTGKYDHLVIKA
jgi:hypothetical protein